MQVWPGSTPDEVRYTLPFQSTALLRTQALRPGEVSVHCSNSRVSPNSLTVSGCLPRLAAAADTYVDGGLEGQAAADRRQKGHREAADAYCRDHHTASSTESAPRRGPASNSKATGHFTDPRAEQKPYRPPAEPGDLGQATDEPFQSRISCRSWGLRHDQPLRWMVHILSSCLLPALDRSPTSEAGSEVVRARSGGGAPRKRLAKQLPSGQSNRPRTLVGAR